MEMKTKILLTVVPYLLAGAVGFCLAAPAYNEYSEKANNLDARKKETEELKSKLADSAKVSKEKRELTEHIGKLHDAVPSRPDMEILDIDLEKLSLDSGIELLSIKTADAAAAKKVAETERADTIAGRKDQLANKVKDAAKPAVAAAAAVAGAAAGKGAKQGAGPDAGLAKSTLTLRLVGSYKNLMTFVHKLETYQRVVAVSQVHCSLPSAKGDDNLFEENDLGEGQPSGNSDKLKIKMLLTTYYLP